MQRFVDVLQEGGHRNSLGRAGEVLAAVAADPSRMAELYRCVFADDAWVRMRAIDTVEKLVREEPSCGAPYVESFVEELTRSEQPSVQWHLAQLFALVDLDERQRALAVEWLVTRLSTTDVDWIVAANAMKTLVDFHGRGVVDTATVRLLVELQGGHRSASVRRKAAALLAGL